MEMISESFDGIIKCVENDNTLQLNQKCFGYSRHFFLMFIRLPANSGLVLPIYMRLVGI